MTALVLGWTRPLPPVVVRWGGPDGMIDASPTAASPMPVAAIVGPPGVAGGLPPDTTRTISAGAADAGKIVELGVDGRLDQSVMPVRTDFVRAGVLQIGGLSNGAGPTSGSGLEILGGGSAVVQAYSRDLGVYISLNFDASNIYFRPNGVAQLSASPDGVYFPGGGVRVSGGGVLGFSEGSGGSVVQSGGKAAAVALDRPCGRIVMDAASLGGGASVAFDLINTAIAAADVVLVAIAGGVTPLAYMVEVEAVAAGACRVVLRNVAQPALAEAVTLNFVVLKGAVS